MGRLKWEISPSKQHCFAGLLLVLYVLSLWLLRNHSAAGMALPGCGLFMGGIFFGYLYARRQFFSLPTMQPSSTDVIGMMQVQRHDFLNHLQVVSGLAQLKKTDRVMEYISTAVQELNRERSVTKLLPAETGLVLLSWVQRLRDYGIPCNIELSTDLSRAGYGAHLAALTTELLTNVVNEKCKPEEILLRSSCSNGGAELELIVRGYEMVPLMSLTRSRELARKIGGTLLLDQLEGMVRFRVLLPLPAVDSA